VARLKDEVASGEWRVARKLIIGICLLLDLVIVVGNVRAQAPGQRVTGGKADSLTPEGVSYNGRQALQNDGGRASVPRLIKFSGVMKDGKGDARTGVAGVTFAIYAEQEGGTPVWMETQNVQLDEAGRYTALLGANSSEGVPLELFTNQWRVASGEWREKDTTQWRVASGEWREKDSAERWLGVEGPDIQESPRVLLVSVPYALKAADAETLGGMPASAFVLAQGTQGSGEWRVASGEQGGTAPALKAQAGSAGGAAERSTQAGMPVPLKSKTATTSAAKNAATAAVDIDFVPKYDPTGSLVPSAIIESNGKVGIGTTAPTAALHVIGDTVRVTSGTTAQLQVKGSASSGRFGQDANGAFLANDTSGSSLRFLTNNGNLNEWMRIGSTGSVNIGSAQVAQLGETVFAPDNLDTVHSIIGQSGSQYHFRLSRATPDVLGYKDFLIAPYTYGMAIEYPGTLEVWSGNFSVHNNPRCAPCGPSPNFWVGDEIDTGGLFVTAMSNSGGSSSNVTLAADRFAGHTSHGSMNFVVRNPTDAFKFDVGPFGAEVMAGQITGTASGSSLDLFSGTVQATVRAQSGTTGGVELGSTSNNALSFFTNNGAAQVTLFPSGNFSIGNASDTAPLAVGTAGQFQVSPAGAATIGGGTAITRHISVSTSLAFPQFSAGSCNTLSVTAAGTADGDSVALGIPNALATVNGLAWFGWVSAPGIVSVRGCNVSNVSVPAPPAANVRVDVWQH
jgi:hypothetical protein